MLTRDLKFSSTIVLPLYMLLFCLPDRVASRSKESFISGKQNVTILTSNAFELKQILPALPTVPASDDGSSMDSSISMILAEHRTRRPDILYKFRQYKGGWNITNKHYWASVGFTGVPGLILAVLWFTAFGLAFFVHYCCSQIIKGEQQYLQILNGISLLLIILFTCASVVGCILLSLGQDKFHHEMSHSIDFVVKQSDFTVEKLRNVKGYLADAKIMNVSQIFIPEDEQQQISELNEKLLMVTAEFEEKITHDADKLKRSLNALQDALVVVTGAMLLLVIIGLPLAALGFRNIICTLIFIGWLLAAVTFILCGAFIVLNNAIADTCVAMEEWAVNPTAYTNIDHILSCVNQSITNQTLYRSKQVTNDLLNIVNQVIGNVANADVPPNNPAYYNQSGPQLPELCRPFHLIHNKQQCVANFTSASQVWKNYICTISNGVCITPGRLTPDLYAQLVAAVNVSYGLKHFTPFLLDLIDCKFVHEMFTVIVHFYCPHLQLHTKWVYIGLALISVGVILSLIFWIIYIQQMHHNGQYLMPCENKSIRNHL
ncbi:hypothetical protein SUGI_0106100 [Cryptomeria japonica]|nr:hypothetical protein SUGI_0106100 [Cryptomeria japonica]